MAEIPSGKEIAVEFIPSMTPKLGKVYSNYAQISHSPWEFTLRFCEAPTGADIPRLVQGAEQSNIEITNLVEVLMVPDMIPLVIQALQANYERFRESYKGKADEPIN